MGVGGTWGRAGARLALSSLLLGGMGLSLVLTHHHENKVYGDASAVLSNCPQTETIDCETVNTSAWSEAFGVPIAAFAFPTYALVLFLLWKPGPPAPWLAYAFGIGILTTLASLALFWISSRLIGVLCLYCVTLYGVNMSIPLLAWAAAGRSPLSLLRTTLADLAAWPRTLRVTTVLFALLLAATIGGEQAWRRHLERQAADERRSIEENGGPLVPAGPSSSVAPAPGTPVPDRAAPSLLFSEAEAASPRAAPATAWGPYTLPAPLRRVEKGGKAAPFDLQSRLGKGRPVALLFWFPGYRPSERALDEMAAFFRALPAFDLYAVAGRNEDQRDEEILESAAMLDLPAGLPLLIDDKFAVSNALNTADIPNLALFDGKGRLVASRIKSLTQRLVLPSGQESAEEVIRRMASGADVPRIDQMVQYYPASELFGHCAPAFTARKFDTAGSDTFPGKPSGNKPLLVVFWSSTCKHCQVEIPLLVSWLKRNPGRVEVVSVSHIRQDKPGLASHREVTRKYIRDQHIPWPVLEDPDDAIAELYRSISTPTTYFVTPQGMIVDAWYYPHPSNFDKVMAETLAKVGGAATGTQACTPAPPTPGPRLALDMLAPEGKKVPLASLLDKPAVVHLWATWCAPCMEEIPALLKFGQSIEKSGTGRLVMLSVEDASAGDKIAGFAKKFNLPLRSNRAPSGPLADAVDLSYRLPRTFIVAPGGALVGARQGSQKWDDPGFDEKVLSRLRNAAALTR